ncbi:cell envelope biogenesis protein TolA [Aquabacter cavernae]|uniref:cell envelope biogenesis protein TolA n=1 Tax=Aquabacter cavernae TaxID=2496029 RepID=UPI000F8F16D2|nr:cell envelope biogenesis protein TolA [Aquabacter cavernae]
MRVGLVASSVLHGSILVLALVSFAVPRQFDMPPEAIPVEVVSATDVSKVTKGNEKGKKEEPPKVVAEKVDADKPTPDPNLKVTEKQEVAPTAPSPPPPPTPQPKAEEQKPAPAPAKAEPPPPKADEALKSEPKKDEPKPQQQAQPTPLPPKKPAPPVQTATPQPPTDQKFDADKIAALLDKRAPQRQAATAPQVSQISSQGAPKGQSQTLSLSEQDAFREKVKQCWKMPHINDDKIFAYILLKLNRDGTLAQPPVITDGMMNPDQRALFDAFAASAIRALIQCQPYTMFKPEKYDLWKELEPRFFPNMFGGA